MTVFDGLARACYGACYEQYGTASPDAYDKLPPEAQRFAKLQVRAVLFALGDYYPVLRPVISDVMNASGFLDT